MRRRSIITVGEGDAEVKIYTLHRKDGYPSVQCAWYGSGGCVRERAKRKRDAVPRDRRGWKIREPEFRRAEIDCERLRVVGEADVRRIVRVEDIREFRLLPAAGFDFRGVFECCNPPAVPMGSVSAPEAR